MGDDETFNGDTAGLRPAAPPSAPPTPPRSWKETVPRRKRKQAVRHDGWTPERRAIFLEALAETCNMTMASKAAGLTRQATWQLRQRDGEFALLCEQALEAGHERLREDLLACALGQTPSGNNPESVNLQPEATGPFDPDLAIKVLKLRDGRGRDRRHRSAAPEPVSQAAVDAALLARLEEVAQRLAKR